MRCTKPTQGQRLDTFSESPSAVPTIQARRRAGAALGYAAVVLIVDTLAKNRVEFVIDWDLFNWWLGRHTWVGPRFDLFEFTFWFVIPMLYCLPNLDWGYFGVRRWRRRDLLMLAAIGVLGALALFLIPLFPSLRNTYHGLHAASSAAKWRFLAGHLVWLLSWLPGWEFLHRYFLMTRLRLAWPRYGWLAIPILETAYHLQKPGIEAAGMALLSALLCLWTLRTSNVVLPFLAHLLIEVALLGFLLLM